MYDRTEGANVTGEATLSTISGLLPTGVSWLWNNYSAIPASRASRRLSIGGADHDAATVVTAGYDKLWRTDHLATSNQVIGERSAGRRRG